MVIALVLKVVPGAAPSNFPEGWQGDVRFRPAPPPSRTIVHDEQSSSTILTPGLLSPAFPEGWQGDVKFVPTRPSARSLALGESSWSPTFLAARVATIFYVDSVAGNDSLSGTSPAAAWLTMTKANTGPTGGYVAGDGLRFKGSQIIIGNLSWTTSGLQGLPCTIGSYGPGLATISCANGIGVRVYDCEFVTVSNLIISGSGVNASTGATSSTDFGIRFYDDRSAGNKYRSWYVDGCVVTGCQSGIGFTTPIPSDSPSAVVGAVDLRVTNCTVHDVQSYGIACHGGTTWGAVPPISFPANLGVFKGLYIGYCTICNVFGAASTYARPIECVNVSGVTIERNLVHDNGLRSSGIGDNGSIVSAYADAVTVQFCEVWHTFQGCAIDFDTFCSNSVAQCNFTHENDGAGYLDVGSGGGVNVFRYNVSRYDSLRASENACLRLLRTNAALAHNNTIFNDQNVLISGTSYVVAVSANCQLYNNVFVGLNNMPIINFGAVNPVFVGNLYWTTNGTLNLNGSSTLAAWRATGQESASGINYGVVADPLLQFPEVNNAVSTLQANQLATVTGFDLDSASPAIGAGVPLAMVDVIDGPIDFHAYPTRVYQQWTGLLAAPDVGACCWQGKTLVSGFPRPPRGRRGVRP